MQDASMKLSLMRLLLRLGLICIWVGGGALLACVSMRLGADAQYLAFLPGIMLCGRLYDAVAGIVSAVLSALALWDWFVPPDGFALPSRSDSLHLLAFVVLSLFICWILRQDRRSSNELMRENVELGHKLLLLRTLRDAGGR